MAPELFSLLLLGVVVFLPFLILAAAVWTPRRFGILIAILGTAVGCWIFFAAVRPIRQSGPLSSFDDLDYNVRRGYGAVLMVMFGVTTCFLGGRSLWDAHRPWPDVSEQKDVVAGEDLPRATVENKVHQD